MLVSVVLLMLALVAFPATASAAVPETVWVTSTGYVDVMDDETFPLCDQYTFATATVSYRGFGPTFDGTGTGTLDLSISGPIATVVGTIIVDNAPATVEGMAVLSCPRESVASIGGNVSITVGNDRLCGLMRGLLVDGVYSNQGRLSLMIMGFTACAT